MDTLWNKSGKKLNDAIAQYTVGSDSVLDLQLMPFDIMASIVHAKALYKTGVLSEVELDKITSSLNTLGEQVKAGHITLGLDSEDCHTLIENYLTHKLGDLGKKIHAGRSRNDQVLVALRLYMKNELVFLNEQCINVAEAFLCFSEKYKHIPMPGYSHTKQAMLTTVGHYFGSFVESLLDDADFLTAIFRHIDKNPLGSAAGFGTTAQIDRNYTTTELGFNSIQINSLYCQNSRGKFESLFLEGLLQIMLTLGRFASDLIIFTSDEFDYFSVDDSLVTGSSIMPHKRNLDVMEILRGNVAIVSANQQAIQNISRNLMSGYHRDLQLIKKPLFESVEIVKLSLEVSKIMIDGIAPNQDKIASKIEGGIFSADYAHELVKTRGIPFRDAYKFAVSGEYSPRDLLGNVKSKTTIGAPGNPGFEIYWERINRMRE